MEVSKEDWDKFWKLFGHTKHYRTSLPDGGSFFIAFNPNIGKLEFVNEVTGQKGILEETEFKRLFGKQGSILGLYIKGEKKIEGDLPNDFYIAVLMRHYFKWLW